MSSGEQTANWLRVYPVINAEGELRPLPGGDRAAKYTFSLDRLKEEAGKAKTLSEQYKTWVKQITDRYWTSGPPKPFFPRPSDKSWG